MKILKKCHKKPKYKVAAIQKVPYHFYNYPFKKNKLIQRECFQYIIKTIILLLLCIYKNNKDNNILKKENQRIP